MYLLGASGHAKVILNILKLNGSQIEGFYDDDETRKSFKGLSSLGPIRKAGNSNGEFIISIGSNRVRKLLAENHKLKFRSALHPGAVIDHSVKIGDGTVVMAGALINSDTTIGQHVIINTGAVVDHDCHIEDFAHISPNATLSGGITVKEGAHIGAGASIIPGVTIGRWAIVGAGAVVIRDVPEGATVVGNPAKQIK